jgi:Spy/CpxP family protein refolding chaperone
MKISVLSLFLVGAVMGVPQQMAFAQESTASSPTAPDTGATTSGAGQGQRKERLKAALAQLDLSDSQKQQIQQIRSTVTDRKERRQQIMAVLTPDQKAKLVAMWQAHKNGAQGGAGTLSGDTGDQ